MPALNFMPRFVPAVENGLAELARKPLPHPGVRPKRQTIRKLRKHPINEGDNLYLKTRMRTPECRDLGYAVCAGTSRIFIGRVHYFVDGQSLKPSELFETARDDGFDSLESFVDFFRQIYGLPFYGVLIRW